MGRGASRARRSWRALGGAALFLCALAGPVGAAPPGEGVKPRDEEVDLDLSRRLEVAAPAAARFENPHDMECLECHLPPPGQAGASGSGGPKAGPLRGGDEPDQVCLGCHPSANLHPVGIPAAATTELRSRIDLPLGSGGRRGVIVCLTCHQIHPANPLPALLRVPDAGGRGRQTLCALCHGDRLTRKSPHSKEASACGLCHTAPPREGAANLSASVQQTCDFCHDALGKEHFLALNPFSDPALAGSLPHPGLPVVGGRFTCVTCHDPHAAERGAGGRRTHLLRPAYLRLAGRSVKINPHWKDVMCFSCHAGEPGPGKPALLGTGGRDALCNRCHAGRFARREIHPVGVIPSDKVVIPDKWPLENGKLTCESCHESSLQEGGERFASAGRDNPKFLRGGFVTRNEFCLRCHRAEEYGQMSAHDQLTPSGSIREQSCLFCHSSLPDLKVPGIENVFPEDVDLDAFCTVCHNRHARMHPTADHLVEPSRGMERAILSAPDRIGMTLPLYDGRIVCATCHNPHQPGVLAGDRVLGQLRHGEKRLRLNEGRTICLACHTGK